LWKTYFNPGICFSLDGTGNEAKNRSAKKKTPVLHTRNGSASLKLFKAKKNIRQAKFVSAELSTKGFSFHHLLKITFSRN